MGTLSQLTKTSQIIVWTQFNRFIILFIVTDVNTILLLILLSMSIPLHLLYSIVICVIQREQITITVPLILLYVSFAATQVCLVLTFN